MHQLEELYFESWTPGIESQIIIHRIERTKQDNFFSGGRILIPLPNTRYAYRRKNSICARFAVGIFVICFGLSQLYVLNQSKLLTSVFQNLHKFMI